jgi:serine protease Do
MIDMSFKSDFERERIYEEMEGKHSSKFGWCGKLLSIALLLSIGFASGSIYSTFTNKGESQNTQLNQSSLNLSQVSSTSASNLATTPTSVSDVVAMTADSVVEITQYSTSTTIFSQSYTSKGNGSGVIISSDGYILTNNHVISGAEKITVRLRSGEEYEATVVGKDSKTDVAIIKIDAKNLKAATVGGSTQTKVGDFVLAIGNPLGELGGTVTYGYISALEREIKIDNSTMNLMQFDAAVNPGNSGGGLFNMRGELIGIVSAKSTGYDVEGIGFAIPINDINKVMSDILDLGYATNRAFLGVKLENSSYSYNNNQYGGLFGMFYQQVQYGANVTEVVKDSPAEKAGIKEKDIIVSINGKVISTASEATSEISALGVGDEVEIGIIRDGRTQTVKATLEEYKGQ